MIDKIILILFEIGFGIKLHLIGEISPSELFLLGSCPYYFTKLKISNNRELYRLSLLYLGLVTVQIVTEYWVGNSFNNAARGIAVSIVSYFHVLFLYFYFIKSRSLIAYALIGIILRLVVFGGDLSNIEIGDSAFVGLLKFRIVPIVTHILILLAVLKPTWNFTPILCICGILLIIFGARSGGGILFVAGLINYFLTIKHKFQFKNLRLTIALGCIFLYGCYCIYVQEVLNGSIKSGNSEQLLKVNDPYNPIYLLMAGRSETFVGFIAFMDKPLTGWGAWTNDPQMKYHKLQTKFSNRKYNRSNIFTKEIPSHSVLIGSAMMNGIFAFIFMFCIFASCLKKAYIILKTDDKYKTVILILLIDFIWVMLFSPQSSFRYTIPLEIAFILICYQIIKCKQIELISKTKELDVTYLL